MVWWVNDMTMVYLEDGVELSNQKSESGCQSVCDDSTMEQVLTSILNIHKAKKGSLKTG